MSDQSQSWRQHFSKPAGDLIQLVSCLAGYDMKEVLLRCFKKSKASKITEPTVCAVLQELSDEAEGKAEAVARRLRAREQFMAGRKAAAK